MAKTTKKLEDFFGARRRRVTLVRGELLRSKGNERRMKLSLTMSLSNTTLTDCPEPLLTQFGVMEKQDSALNRARIDIEFDSMAVRIFSTESTTEPVVAISGALLHKFAMVGEGTGEKRIVSAEFLAYMPATKGLYDWAWDATHAEFFIECVKAQGSLNLSDEVEDDEDEEDKPRAVFTQPPPDQRVQVIPPAKKNGPKELKAYHEEMLAKEAQAAGGAIARPAQIEPPSGQRRKPGSRFN